MKNKFILILMIFALFISSCSKEESKNIVETSSQVNVKISGVSYADEGTSQLKLSNSKSSSSPVSKTQTVTVPFNEELAVEATLVAEGMGAATAVRASGNLKMATTPISLGVGAKYLIAAYNAAGGYIKDSGVLTYATSGTNWNLMLAPGAYTFVAVAVANGNAFPSINLNQNLSTITFNVTGADTDVLWKKQTVNVVAGQNLSLNLILSHLFTQVQATLESTSANVVGNITAIASSSISPNYGTAAVKLIDGLLTQGGTSTARPISLTGTGLTWTSSPVLIITEGTTVGKVNFGTVTLNATQGGIRSGLIDLSNLSLQKGVKYNLKLRLIPRGSLDIPTSNFYWGSANLTGTSPIIIGDSQYAVGQVYNGNGSATYCSGALGSGWNTPSAAQYQSLISTGTVRGSYNGKTGWFLGTSVVPTTNLDNYMFLPDNNFVRSASGNVSTHIPADALGVYWADYTVQGTAKPALVLTATGVSIVDIHQNNQVGIRCVRTK